MNREVVLCFSMPSTMRSPTRMVTKFNYIHVIDYKVPSTSKHLNASLIVPCHPKDSTVPIKANHPPSLSCLCVAHPFHPLPIRVANMSQAGGRAGCISHTKPLVLMLHWRWDEGRPWEGTHALLPLYILGVSTTGAVTASLPTSCFLFAD